MRTRDETPYLPPSLVGGMAWITASSRDVWIGIGLGGLLAITCALLVGLVISVLSHL
jgi:hypothetical protein